MQKFTSQQEQYLTIPGPAGLIEMKVFDPGEHGINIAAIICHPHPLQEGTMENKVITTLFRTFRDFSMFTIRFNYRGVGNSEGSYGETIGESEDLMAVINWAKQQKPECEIILAGFSFGTYIAARVSQLVSPKYLITVAPPVNHFDFDSLQLPSMPWLIIQGERDEVVPASQVISWVAKHPYSPKLVILPETSHFFHSKLVVLREIVESELQNLMAKH